ncbi:MAG: AraC family transcriptional regulator [Bacteroidaceae bacterium]|nr:AraC family transcriptional regulator [Bacteroidaceae bacterium]MBR1793663.1 AraC family transcriptional regulator [Bacteroidales bacterium]
MNEALQHPIDRLESEIEAQGLVVIDNVTRLPAYGEPYISPHMVIGLNLRGQVKAEYDMRPVVFHPHEISVLYPNHIVLGRESSEDYQAVLVVISSRFFDELRKMASYRNPLVYHNAPAIQLDEQQFEAVQNIINLLRSVSRMQIPARTIMIANLLEVLSLLLTEYRQKTQSVSLQQQSKEKLFSRFYDAIVKHHRDSREVSYYADLLYLSPKYFGSVIKRETGISAGDWIANYVVIQAKSLLSTRRDLSIQQISHQLGFPDQAAFSRYFRSNAKISPSEYRAGCL